MLHYLHVTTFRVYEKIMKELQEKEASARGLRKVILNWAKKKGHKGSEKKMEE